MTEKPNKWKFPYKFRNLNLINVLAEQIKQEEYVCKIYQKDLAIGDITK